MGCLLLLATLAASIFSTAVAVAAKYSKLDPYEEFRRRHGHRRGGADTVGYHTRRLLFNTRVAQIDTHNAHSSTMWTAAVNRFADFTDEERHALLGHRPGVRNAHSVAAASFLEMNEGATSHAIATVDYRQKLRSSTFVRDQGSCGSCWAVAAVGALEMHSELRYGNTTELAFQEFVDCVSNPRHCGGTGGCDGATAELAFDYATKHGLSSDKDYAAGTCQGSPRSTSVLGWQRLPENEVAPLLHTVAHSGPVVVSVDGSKWFEYSEGIFNGCEKDAIVNHAVLLVGYGTDASVADGNPRYWLIRNSWGEGWGENGFIRLLRHSGDRDHCGIDNEPKKGVGCDSGPKEIMVCGMCGVLSDSSHPVGARIAAAAPGLPA